MKNEIFNIRIIEKKDLRADQDTGNSVQELDYPTEENKREFQDR